MSKLFLKYHHSMEKKSIIVAEETNYFILKYFELNFFCKYTDNLSCIIYLIDHLYYAFYH